MTADPTTAPHYESLADTDEALASMMRRLRAILDEPALTEATFVETAAIFDNVSYLFLYLESNEAHVTYDSLLPWRDAFHQNPGLDAELLERLRSLRCAEPDAEESRLAYVRHLEDKKRQQDHATPAALEELQAEAKSVLARIQADQAGLLGRLGVAGGVARPAAAFYRLVSETKSAATRTKLTRAWDATRDRRLPELIRTVDQMVALRWKRSTALGFDSVLAQTFTRCRVSEETASAYLDRHLTRAVDSHAGLEDEIRAALGPVARPTDHFGHYLRELVGGRRTPLLVLEECLDFAFLVADKVFGLAISLAPASSPHVRTVDVALDGEEIGRITFDLWDIGPTPRSANYTLGIRNRTDWAGVVQRPVAYVSCRFQRSADGASRITFQNAHSLFHEFGHALNHLLIRKRLPNQSGLEYLPLERLEDLSMWFEKWVYHGQFADSLSLKPDEREGLALSRRVKMLEYRRTHVDRAVTAALDFAVHALPDTGIEDAFARLDERRRISQFCGLGDFPGYFTWPMLQANPGANFSYLWGAARSAAQFAPFIGQRLADVPPPAKNRARFSACFDYDEPSTAPDGSATFTFYDEPGMPGTGGHR